VDDDEGELPEIEYLTVAAVTLLPHPGDVSGPPCMVRRRRLPERLWRQVRPRPPSDCCVYHQGDWRELSAAAIRLVAAAKAAGLTNVDAISEFVREVRSKELDARGDHDTLPAVGVDALVSMGLAIQPGGGRPQRYYEGRHRVIAMIDAGVHRTIVLKSKPNPAWVE